MWEGALCEPYAAWMITRLEQSYMRIVVQQDWIRNEMEIHVWRFLFPTVGTVLTVGGNGTQEVDRPPSHRGLTD